MATAGHRKPRGRASARRPPDAADRVPPLAEALGSAVAPADVGPVEKLTPLDHDGLVPVAAITLGWGIAAVVLLLTSDDLAADDRTWWLWTCVAGFGLGLLGYAYCRRRRDAIRAQR